MKNLLFRPWFWYCLVTSTPLVISFFLFKLHQYPLSVPLGYQGDAYFSAFIIKQIHTHGFSYAVPELGYPFGLTLYDFPFADTSYFILTSWVGLVTQNPFVSLNLLYLTSFVMISLSSYLVWRQMNISPWNSWWGSLLFSFLPFHLIRGPYHLFLGNYWFIPFVVYISAWIMDDKTFPLPNWMHKPWLTWTGLVGVTLIAAGGGIYYALFSMFLLGVGGTFALIRRTNWQAFRNATILILIIGLGILVQFLPTIMYTQQVGKNLEAGVRLGIEADNNSLSLLRLSMPLQNIGLAGMQDHVFDPQRPLVDMEKRQYLGWGALLGLVLIGWRALLKPAATQLQQTQWQALFILSIAIWILAMPGGLGTILAFAVSPQIRAYGRILPFLAFLAITGLLYWLKEYSATTNTSIRFTRLSLFSSLIFVGSLWSQLSWYQPPTPELQAGFNSDAEFIRQIDALQPKAVYQLPYKAFPETPEIERISDYDLLKGYLHSHQPTRWSYASMKGRPGAEWLAGVAQFPLEVQIQSIQEVGFEGIYLDRFGWADNGQTIEASLSALLRQTPLVSKDGRLVYYQL